MQFRPSLRSQCLGVHPIPAYNGTGGWIGTGGLLHSVPMLRACLCELWRRATKTRNMPRFSRYVTTATKLRRRVTGNMKFTEFGASEKRSGNTSSQKSKTRIDMTATNKAGAGNGAGALSFHVARLRRAVPDLVRSPKSSVSSLDGAWPFGRIPL